MVKQQLASIRLGSRVLALKAQTIEHLVTEANLQSLEVISTGCNISNCASATG